MPTTPLFDLPFPESDDVADVPTDIQALAEALSPPKAVGSFSVAHYLTTPGFSVATGAGSVLLHPNEQWDVSNWYDPATGRYTPQLPGYYELFASAWFLGETGLTHARLTLRKNGDGSENNGGHVLGDKDVTAGQQILLRGAVLVAANGSTDYFDVFASHNDADDVGLAERFFQGRLVGHS